MTDSEKSNSSDIIPPSETRRKQLEKYLYALVLGVVAPGGAFAIMTLVYSYSAFSLGTYMVEFYTLLVLTVLMLSIGIPFLRKVLSEYRKCELPLSDYLEVSTVIRRVANQCTICQRHPVSKKYHIKNIHNVKNAKINDYFVDCGCMKCADHEIDHSLSG